ncbi:hypothetical protein [Bacillus sp. 2205SS5-2]|uniref:hypothetical protein n=1 Tax=Bacillus sp. 2205SS5-2 TaxID=3109031 RepID=UPI0030060F68
MTLVNQFWINILLSLTTWKEDMISTIQEKKVEYNAWFTILLAVLMVLAFTVFAALTIWCVVEKGKAFSGDWKWSTTGVSVKAECI